MGYTTLNNRVPKREYSEYSLEGAVFSFIRNRCENLRFDMAKNGEDGKIKPYTGKSIKQNQIPYNMEQDIDRLCIENALLRFLKSGKKEDAFDVYFCYLEMFVGDYEKTRRMIELLSEFEANGSSLLMKHRDHYSHSVYVFCLGLAIYESNSIFREKYKNHYNLCNENEAAHHYLEYWGLASLFHDIGYPFELPFEQACSYFEVNKEKREKSPFLAYRGLEEFIRLGEKESEQIKKIEDSKAINDTNEMFAYLLYKKIGKAYQIDEEQMLGYLRKKPESPDTFNYFMDHAYFSATVLFKKLFGEMGLELKAEHLDSLTAILMHNSLYKFCIANPTMDAKENGMHLSYKKTGNIPLKAEVHPLAYMLMLCDELQCWDRTAYGRNSRHELHPMGCSFDFSDNKIKASYLYDKMEMNKVDAFKDKYVKWLEGLNESEPKLKAYSSMYIKKEGKSDFQKDIETIVDLSEIELLVDIGWAGNVRTGNRSYLCDSNFINLYNFAIILNGRWGNNKWKEEKLAGREDEYLSDDENKKVFTEEFKNLSLEYKLSNINQAKAFAKYMDEIGCFYTDKQVDFEMLVSFTEEELLKIGYMEHQRWLQEHYDMGWKYGTPDKKERDFLRLHKDMIPGLDDVQEVSEKDALKNYERLDKETQDKDTDPMECMLALLKMYDGLRIYRL